MAINSITSMDILTKRISAFNSFQELLDAEGGYYPSLHVSEIAGTLMGARELADAYDQAQAARGDSRRAFRY